MLKNTGYISWVLVGVVILGVLGIFAVQFSQATIVGADGFLHARMAELISGNGFIKSFGQARFSWFATRFSDKDFLYHLYLIAFNKAFGFIMGTKMAAAAAGGLLFASVVFIIYYNHRRLVPVFVSLTYFLSAGFLRDISEPRPFVLAMTVTLFTLAAIMTGNIKAVFFLCIFLGMLHLSAWVLPLFALLLSVYYYIKTGRQNFRVFIAAAAGYLGSFLLHPNFPNNIFYMYLNGMLVPIYAVKTGVLELGAEFFPLNTSDVLSRYPVTVLTIVVIFIFVFTRTLRPNNRLTGWGLAFLLFSLFSIFSTKNFTLAYPITIVFLATAVDVMISLLKTLHKNERIRLIPILTVLIFVFIGFSIFNTVRWLNAMLLADNVYARHFAAVAGVINQKIPKGELIFHSNWSDSQYLIGLAPDYDYYVTLDPIYMYSFNRELYQKYRTLSFGKSTDPYQLLLQEFHTAYGYAGKNYFNGLISQVRADNRFNILYEDNLGIVFRLMAAEQNHR